MNMTFDLKAFWEENRRCSDRFTTDKPRLALSLGIGEDVIKSVAGVTNHPRFYKDYAYQQRVRAQAGEIIERETGIAIGPAINAGSVTFASLFGGEVVYPDNAPPWIRPVIHHQDDIRAAIRRVDGADLRTLGIMPWWLEWRQRILDEYGVDMTTGYSFHGPATMSAMLCGTTRFLYLVYDYPELMRELYRAIEETGLRFMREMREFMGLSMRGMGVYDDDSALLSPKLFAEYEYPVLERWYAAFCPDPADRRYFHSDGDMSHLLDLLRQLGVSHVNLGPQVDLLRIRERMPRTVIHGHIPPFLVRNGNPDEIAALIARQFRQVGHDGGMVVETAGSLNEGTPLENMRAMMVAVDRHCRFDGRG